MAVRTHLSWRWKIPALLALFVLIAGMWWWGFDFGQFLSGFNRGEVAREAGQARGRSRPVQGRERKAPREGRAARERSQHHAGRPGDAVEAIARRFRQKTPRSRRSSLSCRSSFSDTGKQGTVSIQRLTAERERDDAYHYSLLVVRGGNPTDEFAGQLDAAGGRSSPVDAYRRSRCRMTSLTRRPP